MKTPPLLLGATLLFWGFQTGYPAVAAVMALILEGSRLFTFRWDFSSSDFNRISDLCTLILIGMLIYLFISIRSVKFILVLLQWVPVAVFPLLIFQVYGTSDKIDISALFLLMRRRRDETDKEVDVTINLTYPYFMACILSASAANVRDIWFYAGLMGLSAWALWFQRCRRFSPIIWGVLFLLAGTVGYAGHIGLRHLQLEVEKKGLEWFTAFIQQDSDPYRSRTAIGDIGELKLSDRIVFRVATESQLEYPLLLREAGYNKYSQLGWFALPARFTTVMPEKNGTAWKIQPSQKAGKAIVVSSFLRNGKGMLKLPIGAFSIESLPVMNMRWNQFGAVRVEDGPGLVNYEVQFTPSSSMDNPPNIDDLSIPQIEAPAITAVANDLDLRSISHREVLRRLDAYFRANFNYSLILDRPDSNLTPLAHFLLKSRAGHCEYFATATVLLLRAARIPARYASGYSVQEFSRWENCFVVRARHAHSWVLVYMDGVWQNFDTTPPSWFNIEDNAASMWQPIYDVWSWCMLKFSHWRWVEREGGLKKYGVWLLIPFFFVFFRKFYSKTRVRRLKKEKEKTHAGRSNPGADSEFYLIEKRLNEFGFVRSSGEAISSWIKRINASRSSFIDTESLSEMAALHYRYRFDPEGLSTAEKATLGSNVASWLLQNRVSGNFSPE